MRIFPRFLPAAAILLAAVALASSQQPAATPQSDSPAASRLHYFSLEHRSPDHLDAADATILHARGREMTEEAAFYGYDISTGSWTWDQAICPQLPDSILLHYFNRQPSGAESRFTALVPRHEGRIRIVPVYYHSATPFHPAVKSNRNFVIFNAAVPADIAQKSTDPQGDWLSFAACYVELVGGEPNIPNEPSLAPKTLLAPPPNIEVTAANNTRQIHFTDRDAEDQYLVWTVSLNGKGQITATESQTYQAFAAKISNPPAPPSTTITNIPAPPTTVLHPTPVPH